MNAYCIQCYMEYTFTVAKTGTVRQSDKTAQAFLEHYIKRGHKKGAAAAKSFHLRSLIFFKTEGNHRYLDKRDQYYQFLGHGRKY